LKFGAGEGRGRSFGTKKKKTKKKKKKKKKGIPCVQESEERLAGLVTSFLGTGF
jgi:hypothetical protein